MATININLVQHFSDCPGGRYRANGEFSGEAFREDHLRPALADPANTVTIDMNHAFTIPPSFLDEAFGILVEEMGEQKFRSRVLVVINDDPAAEMEYEDVIEKHSRRSRPSGFLRRRREYA